jgi:hypothetical protein
MQDVGNAPAALSRRQGLRVTDGVPMIQEIALINPDGVTYLVRVRTYRTFRSD